MYKILPPETIDLMSQKGKANVKKVIDSCLREKIQLIKRFADGHLG